jgi:hypothetical protein
VRVEHNRDTLLIHVSGEDGHGWTTIAIDRPTREWSIAQRDRQRDAAESAYAGLYAGVPRPRHKSSARNLVPGMGLKT